MDEQDIRQKTSDLFDAYEALVGHKAELNLQDFLELRGNAIREIDLGIATVVSSASKKIEQTPKASPPRNAVEQIEIQHNVPKQVHAEDSHSASQKSAPQSTQKATSLEETPQQHIAVSASSKTPSQTESVQTKTHGKQTPSKYEQEFARLKSMPDPWN